MHRENDSASALADSLQLFADLANSRWFAHTPVALVFTHCDLFRAKVAARGGPIAAAAAINFALPHSAVPYPAALAARVSGAITATADTTADGLLEQFEALFRAATAPERVRAVYRLNLLSDAETAAAIHHLHTQLATRKLHDAQTEIAAAAAATATTAAATATTSAAAVTPSDPKP